MKVSELCSFIAPYMGAEVAYNVRVVIGHSKRSARTWPRKPYALAGRDPNVAARQILDWIDEERGPQATRAWIAVYEHGDTAPSAWAGGREGIYLSPVETDEQPEEHGLKVVGADTMIGALVQGTLQSAAADRVWATARLRDSQERIDHLEGMVAQAFEARLRDAITIAELRAGAAGPDAMTQAIGAFGPAIAAALPELVARFGGGATTGAPPHDNGGPNDDQQAPDVRVERCLVEVETIAADPDLVRFIVTPERMQRLRAAAAAIMLAASPAV